MASSEKYNAGARLIAYLHSLMWASKRLTFRVLGGLAGAFEAGLLAFLHTRVACEKASFAQCLFPLGVGAQERPRDAVTDGSRLSAGAAADDTHSHGVGVFQFEQAQGGNQGGGGGLALTEVLARAFAVHDNGAITIGEETHAGYSRLASSHSIVVLTFNGIDHCRFSSSLLFCR